MRTAYVNYTTAGAEIKSPYDEDFLRELKEGLPHFVRSWDKDRKLWLIRGSYFVAIALEIAQQHFQVVELNKREEQQDNTHSERRSRSDGPHAVLHLLPTAPPELVKAAFHTLAKKCHPDAGGNTAEMQKINEAYEKLRK